MRKSKNTAIFWCGHIDNVFITYAFQSVISVFGKAYCSHTFSIKHIQEIRNQICLVMSARKSNFLQNKSWNNIAFYKKSINFSRHRKFRTLQKIFFYTPPIENINWKNLPLCMSNYLQNVKNVYAKYPQRYLNLKMSFAGCRFLGHCVTY